MIDRCHYNFFSRVFPENKFINVLINSKMHNIWCESLAILPLTCFLGVWYNIGVENIWEVLFWHTDIYKIEIEVDEKKIKTENNFTFDEVCEKIRSIFAKQGIDEDKSSNNVLSFFSNKRDSNELAKFGVAEKDLIDKQNGILVYLKKIIWYDTLHGAESKEDVLEVAKRHNVI